MGKPFIVSNKKGINALGRYVAETGARSYSYSYPSDTKVMVSLHIGDGGGRFRVGGVLVTQIELFDEAEAVIRKTLGWEPASKQA